MKRFNYKKSVTNLCAATLVCALFTFCAAFAGVDGVGQRFQDSTKKLSSDHLPSHPNSKQFKKRVSLTPTTPSGQEQAKSSQNVEQPSAGATTDSGQQEPREVKKPSEASDENAEQKINPNLNNVSLSSFIKYMAELKKINLIPSAEANESKVTLTLREALPISRAWEVFLTVLDSCGFCLVKIGEVQKVMKKDSAMQEPIRVVINANEKNLTDSSAMVRAVVFLKNIPVTQAEGLVKSFLDQRAQTYSQQSLNALIVTDREINIKSALAILNAIDNSGVKETCCVIRLSNSTATDVKKFLDDIIRRPETSALARLLGQQSEGGADFFPGTVKLVADDRTNSIIMLGTESSLKRLSDFIDEYFEGNWQTRTPFETHICQYADVEQLKGILDEIINSDATKNSRNTRGLGTVRMECDKYSNKLIIYAQDGRDLSIVRDLIRDLDKPQPMVGIETLIVTVNEEEIRELGGRIRSRSANSPVKSVDWQGAGTGTLATAKDVGGNIKNLMGNLIGLAGGNNAGSSVLTFGNESKDDVWAILKAVKTNSNTNSVERPFLTVANGQRATLRSESTRTVKTETDPSNNAVSFKQVPATTNLTIKPQISPDGLINLDVDLTIEDFQKPAVQNNGESGADKFTKHVKTQVTLANGGVLVLGGFIKTTFSNQAQKTPILGDVPFLGWFGRSKNTSNNKTYTFMFISPTIMKPMTVPGCGLYSKIKLHDAKESIENSYDLDSKDPVNNWFFEEKKIENAHKIIDFANAKYQPTTVDIKNDDLYRGKKISLENFYRDIELSKTVHLKKPIGDDFVNIISKEPCAEQEAKSMTVEKKGSMFDKTDFDLGQKRQLAMINSSRNAPKLPQLTTQASPAQDKVSRPKGLKSKRPVIQSFEKSPTSDEVVQVENKPKVKLVKNEKPVNTKVFQHKKQPRETFVDKKELRRDVYDQQVEIVPLKKIVQKPGRVGGQNLVESFDEHIAIEQTDDVDFDQKVLSKARINQANPKTFIKFLDVNEQEQRPRQLHAKAKELVQEQQDDDFDRQVQSKLAGRQRMISL